MMRPGTEPPATDASPLIYLARVGRFDLLQVAGPRVIVPRVVVSEIRRSVPEEPAARAIAVADWIDVVDVRESPAELAHHRLGLGESAVMTWALDDPGTLVIIDEQAARHVAGRFGIPVIGTLALVVEARRRGLAPEARGILDDLRRAGMYLSERVINYALLQAGEL